MRDNLYEDGSELSVEEYNSDEDLNGLISNNMKYHSYIMAMNS